MLKKGCLTLSFVMLFISVLSGQSLAMFGHEALVRSSEVSTVISYDGAVYSYNYTLANTSVYGFIPDESGQPIKDPEGNVLWAWPLIVDYEVPLTTPGDIWAISSPAGWAHEILSAEDYVERYGESNPFHAPYILHWHDVAITWNNVTNAYSGIALNPIAPIGYNDAHGTSYAENWLCDFIFSSSLSPVDGPYLSSWQDEARYIADPPLPGGLVGGGGTIPFVPSQDTQVPEPSSLLLLAAGILGAAGIRRFRRK